MKVGSIVECIKDYSQTPLNPAFKIFRIPVYKEIYVVRNIVQCPVTEQYMLHFEEFIVGYNLAGEELGSPIDGFRELEFPPDFEEELEEVKNLEFQPV